MVELRNATPDDVGAIQWALYAALDWAKERTLPPRMLREDDGDGILMLLDLR